MSREPSVTSREFLKRRLRKQVDASDFDEVLRLLAATEERRPLEVHELILKGRASLLAEGGEGDPVEDTEEPFLEVLRRDPPNVEANLELGWLYFAVADDPRRALPYFERAKAGLESALAEAERGLRDCLLEIDEERR